MSDDFPAEFDKPEVVKFEKTKLARIPVTIRLNAHLINRLIRKLQDRIDEKFLQSADPEGYHRQGFCNRGARNEIFNFIDTALNMFGNRKLLKSQKAVETNTDLKSSVRVALEFVNDFQFVSEIPQMIEEEVVSVFASTRHLVESDGYYSPFLFTLEVGDHQMFIRALVDIMNEALLTHYVEVLVDYRKNIAILNDHDRTARPLPLKVARASHASLAGLSKAFSITFIEDATQRAAEIEFSRPSTGLNHLANKPGAQRRKSVTNLNK